jgi:GNAT superfamily N-acetyltransferase
MLSSPAIGVKARLLVADGTCMGMPAEHLPDRLDVHIAPFQGDEVEAIAELCRGCATRTEDSLGNWEWCDAAELERQLEQWEVSTRSTLFVAREAGRVVGFCGVECFPRERTGLVHGPVVAPAARGKGVSKALFEVALRNAVKHGAAELWAATGRDNRRAQALYGEAGFTRDEVTALFELERAAHTPLAAPAHVRRVTPNDLPEVLALAESLGDDLHMTLDELASALLDPTWHVWVAGEPDASALLCIDPSERWIRVLATREDSRRRGLGAVLLSAAVEAWWADQHEESLGLSVRAESLAVVTQYHRLGFQPTIVAARFSRVSGPSNTMH